MAPPTWWLLLTILLAGCVAEDWKAQAERAAAGYFEAVKAKDPDRAVAFFAERYLETRGVQGLKTDTELIATRLGQLREYRLTAARRRIEFIPPDSGTFVTLEYEVRYAKHRAKETFTIHKPLVRGEPRIVGHRIVSEGFLRE
jgi:hypothetical protein